MGLVAVDPLYLYSQQSAHQVIADYLDAVWGPLLIYLQEIYSPPISLSGKLSAAALPLIRPFLTSAREPKCLKWSRSPETSPGLIMQQYLSRWGGESGGAVIGGTFSKLTISIPLDPQHEFWKTPINDSVQLGLCDPPSFPCEGTCSFEVQRWGFNNPYADYNATLRAIDTMQEIRKRIIITTTTEEQNVNYPVTVTEPSTYPPNTCPVIALAYTLQSHLQYPIDSKYQSMINVLTQFSDFPGPNSLLLYYKVPNYLPTPTRTHADNY